MIRLHQIASPENAAVDVIFVHGLKGDAFETWQHNKSKPEDCWLHWLASDLSEIAVHSLEYDASPSNWLGRSMRLVDQATNILTYLETRNLGLRPIVWVTHSMGGLLIKQLLRHASDQPIEAWHSIAKFTRSVVFLATPHAGAGLATWLHRLGKIMRCSDAIEDLREHDANLANLNLWYRKYSFETPIKNHCFFECWPRNGVIVVNRTSADPGIHNVVPRPVEADHISISKPSSRSHPLFQYLLQVVGDAATWKPPSRSVRSSVPPRNPDFVGRVEEISQILSTLEGGGAVLTALEGMGGIGKTATGIEAIHLLREASRFKDGFVFIDLGGFSETNRPKQPIAALTELLRILVV